MFEVLALPRARRIPCWLLVWLAAFALPRPVFAQSHFDVWTADDGLPQNVIRDVTQTSDGYLWIATLDGLARFDGVRFTIFDRSNTPGIESNRFTSLQQDRHGDLWLGTEGHGVTRYHAGRFTTYTTQHGLPHNTIRTLIGDGSGGVRVLTRDSIADWRPDAGRFVDVTPVDRSLGSDAYVWDAYVWERGGLWGVSRTSFVSFTDSQPPTIVPLPSWLSGRDIVTAARADDDTIWLETLSGQRARIIGGRVVRDAPRTLTYRDRHGHESTFAIGRRLARLMTDPGNPRVAPVTFERLREDREGNIWLATGGAGLYRLRRRFIKVDSTDQGLLARFIYPIFQDRAGAVWVGAWEGGLSRFADGRITNFTPTEGLASRLPTTMAEDREGRLWVGSFTELRVFERGRFHKPEAPVLPPRAVTQSLHFDREGTGWFGTSLGLLCYKGGVTTHFTAKDGLAGDDVRVIVDGAAGPAGGELWIGGLDGLTRRDASGRFSHWTERDGLPSNAVRAIHYDKDGIVWIGTYDGGLGRFDPRAGRFTRYTTREGLFNNGAFQILEDDRGMLWMSSNRGIYRVAKRELNEMAAGRRTRIASVSYGRSDGMRNVECNGGYSPAGVRARDGRLWFPTQDGVAVIDPNDVPGSLPPPPVAIESFLIDGTPAPLDRPPSIKPGETSFEITYTALSFVNSGQIHFEYTLEGLDPDWIQAGPRRTAYYSRVPPGRYVFRVIARSNDGVWNREGRSLTVTVLAPFYRTWWFSGLAAGTIVLIVWGAWWLRARQFERERATQRAFARQLVESQERERKRIAGELHDSLGQRLVIVKNLALFFLRAQRAANAAAAAATNAGGTVSPDVSQIEEITTEASLAIDETRAIAYNLRPFQLDRLGLTRAIDGMLRTTAAASGVTITREMDNIDDVFAEDLRIHCYRIVQESLTNIVKHAHATAAHVTVKRTPAGVSMTIRDNGTGFTPGAPRPAGAGGAAAPGTPRPPSPGGFGLTGMTERARLLDGTVAIQSTPGGGTIVRVEFATAAGTPGTHAVGAPSRTSETSGAGGTGSVRRSGDV